MRIVVTLDISPDSINLEEQNSSDVLESYGRDEDETFDSKLEFLEFVADQIRDDSMEINDVVNDFNAVVETEAFDD